MYHGTGLPVEPHRRTSGSPGTSNVFSRVEVSIVGLKRFPGLRVGPGIRLSQDLVLCSTRSTRYPVQWRLSLEGFNYSGPDLSRVYKGTIYESCFKSHLHL